MNRSFLIPAMLFVAVGLIMPEHTSAQSRLHKKAIKKIEAGNKEAERRKAQYSIEELMKKYRVPGVTVVMFENFEIAWSREYGMAHIEEDVKVTPVTTFQAGSISKPVSALAAMIALEGEKFELDVPINSLLTSWQLPENELTETRAVTPRMLLSHTGGTSVHGFGGYDPGTEIPTLPELLDGKGNSGAVIVDLEPFTQWRYSGGGTTIMQLAMEDLHAEEFETILDRTVLGPLAMTSSTFRQPIEKDDAPNAAFANGGKGKVPWHIYPEQAAAGLWTTPTDLAKFAIAVQKILRGDKGIVTKETAIGMITPMDVGGGYGLGFSVTEDGNYFGHGGSDWGFISSLRAHQRDGYGVVVMTNGAAGNHLTQELTIRISEAYGWDPSS